jgi:hypothetical protein
VSYFQKFAQYKQSPSRRNFAQSGHPCWNLSTFLKMYESRT